MAIADIYQKATLVQIPSGYKAADAELYSVVPNTTAGDFTVSVDAYATRVNKDGLIESVAANQARLNYDPTNPQDPTLLLEPQRTNYATNNSSMDTYGTVGGSSPNPTLTANYTTAPDGSNTATRLQTTVTGSSYSLISFPNTTLGNGTYYISVYAKSNTGSNQTISFYGADSTTQAHTVTPEWTRIIVEATRGSGLPKYAFLGTWASQHGSDASIDISVWGAQIEVDSDYATSLIPTSGSAVTRTVDTCGTSDTNLINNTEGTLFVDFEFSEQGTTSLYQIPIGLYNSGGGGAQRITIDNYSGKLRIYVVSDGGTRALWDAANPISNVVANQRYKVAIRYKDGDCASYVNGELYKADSGSVSGFNLVKMVFGYANFGNTLMHRGKIYQAMYFNEALTNAELITLTS